MLAQATEIYLHAITSKLIIERSFLKWVKIKDILYAHRLQCWSCRSVYKADTILYWEHARSNHSMHLTYIYFTKHLHYWLASQPAPTLVCRVCCRTGGCWGKTTGSSSYSTVLLCASLASGLSFWEVLYTILKENVLECWHFSLTWPAISHTFWAVVYN